MKAYQIVEEPLKVCNEIDYKEVDIKMEKMRADATKFWEILDE